MKKVLSVLAIVVFTVSNLNATVIVAKSCMDIAVDLHVDLQEAGMSHAEAYRISGEVLDACEAAQ